MFNQYKNSMKKFLIALLPLVILAVASCSKEYNDSELRKRIDDLDARLTTLQTQMNSQISELRALIAKLEDKDYVLGVETTTSPDGLPGWIIKFTKSAPITIYTGSAGKDGKDGKDAPVIGVKAEGGVYYWTLTLNGVTEWLLDADNQKIQASAVDGITPEIKIEKVDGDKDHWFVYYGTKKVDLGIVSADITGILFKEVTTDEDNAYFKLWDETVITVPLAKPEVKLQIVFDDADVLKMAAADTLDIPYTVIVPEGVTATISTFETGGWLAYVIPLTATSGNLRIISPDPKVDGKILVSVVGSDGSSYARVIVAPATPSVSVPVTNIVVDCAAGQVSLNVLANVAFNVVYTADWITDGPVKGVLNIGENSGYVDRSAEITVETADKSSSVKVNLVQKQKDAILVTPSSVEIDPQAQDIPVIVKANVDIVATKDVDWITSVAAADTTAAAPLTTYGYVISVSENTGAIRSGNVEFSGVGKDILNKDITVKEKFAITQYKYREEGSAGTSDYNNGTWKW